MVNKREKKKNSLADQSVAGWSTGIDRKRVPGIALLPFVGGKIIPPLVGSLSTKKSQVSFCASVSIMSFFSALITGDLLQWPRPSVCYAVILGLHNSNDLRGPLLVRRRVLTR